MKKFFSFKKISVAFLFCVISPLCFAVTSPVDQLQTVANKMISQLEANKSQLGDMSVIRGIVNRVLIPNVDVNRMSASVVGRYWREATPLQRTQFEKAFSSLVTTTYASALSSFNDDKVIFQPLRENFNDRQTVRVSSVIARKNGQRIPITYDVVRKGNDWKVYDFSIEHVSMVQSYHSQFSEVLNQGGMAALLVRLERHNQASR
jgi:phospholipid transport system substrate-binding protein